MVVIKFPDTDTLADAIGFLAESFSGHVLPSGEVIVPESALEALAAENFSFTVIGKATHDQALAALRGHVPAKVQRRKARPKKLVRKSASRSR